MPSSPTSDDTLRVRLTAAGATDRAWPYVARRHRDRLSLVPRSAADARGALRHGHRSRLSFRRRTLRRDPPGRGTGAALDPRTAGEPRRSHSPTWTTPSGGRPTSSAWMGACSRPTPRAPSWTGGASALARQPRLARVDGGARAGRCATTRAAVERLLDAIMTGSYADSLYAIFGRPASVRGPRRPSGDARRGGWASTSRTRDSLALDPGRMTSVRQLRHTLAHELAHRWQARVGRAARGPLAGRAGDSRPQAVRVRQPIGAPGGGGRVRSSLPPEPRRAAGTYEPRSGASTSTSCWFRAPARWRATSRMQPVFAHHPLRAMLTTGRQE